MQGCGLTTPIKATFDLIDLTYAHVCQHKHMHNSNLESATPNEEGRRVTLC